MRTVITVFNDDNTVCQKLDFSIPIIDTQSVTGGYLDLRVGDHLFIKETDKKHFAKIMRLNDPDIDDNEILNFTNSELIVCQVTYYDNGYGYVKIVELEIVDK